MSVFMVHQPGEHQDVCPAVGEQWVRLISGVLPQTAVAMAIWWYLGTEFFTACESERVCTGADSELITKTEHKSPRLVQV